MSLENALNNLADAIKAQTALLAGNAAPAPAKAAGKGKTAEAAPADENDNAGPAKAAAKDAGKKAPAAGKAAPAPASSAAVIDPAYAPVKTAILDAIAKGHRTQVTAVLKEYGAATGQDLTPDVYDEVLGKLDEIVNPAAEGDLA